MNISIDFHCLVLSSSAMTVSHFILLFHVSNIRLYLIILQPCYINADICCFLTSFELKTRLECKYCWYVLREWISQRNIAPKAKLGIWHAIRSLFRTKGINNGMFIEDVTRRQQWRQYDIILITWYYICITWVLIKILGANITTSIQRPPVLCDLFSELPSMVAIDKFDCTCISLIIYVSVL
jgi:hypothetical protein